MQHDSIDHFRGLASNPRTAVILAAGRGKRLKSLTLDRSKAMLPIVGKPVVQRVMETLTANGLDDFVLVIRPEDWQLVRYFRTESTITARVRFAYQERTLGMAHALRCAAPLLDGPFILSACDNLVSVEDVRKLVKRWAEKPLPNGVLTLLPVEPDRLGSVGIVEMDGPWVNRIIEKPQPEQVTSNISSLPLYCFSERILAYLEDVPLSPRGEYELQDAIQMLIEREGNICGVEINARLTLTNADDLLALNKHYLDQESSNLRIAMRKLGKATQIFTPVHIESGVEIGNGCRLGPYLYIESGCRIGDGVSLSESVLLGGAVIPARANITGQVIMAGVEV